jgi:hypothetical protein
VTRSSTEEGQILGQQPGRDGAQHMPVQMRPSLPGTARSWIGQARKELVIA